MIYEIAGLKVEMEPNYDRLTRQSAAYASSGTPVMRVEPDPGDLARVALDTASVEEQEYICCGAAFCRELIGHERFFLHASAVVYEDAAYLFSAPSGTGKSTHAKLWQELYDAPPLNGDLNLIGIADGKPVVYGLPWCGTSGIFTTETYPLGGVIFLRQDKMNTVQALTPDTCALMLSQRIISPTWTKEMLLSVLTFCEQATPLITCFELRCTPQAEAASVCRAAIDAALTGSTVH